MHHLRTDESEQVFATGANKGIGDAVSAA